MTDTGKMDDGSTEELKAIAVAGPVAGPAAGPVASPAAGKAGGDGVAGGGLDPEKDSTGHFSFNDAVVKALEKELSKILDTIVGHVERGSLPAATLLFGLAQKVAALRDKVPEAAYRSFAEELRESLNGLSGGWLELEGEMEEVGE